MKNSRIGFQEKEHGGSFKKKEQLELKDCLRKLGVVYVSSLFILKHSIE